MSKIVSIKKLKENVVCYENKLEICYNIVIKEAINYINEQLIKESNEGEMSAIIHPTFFLDWFKGLEIYNNVDILHENGTRNNYPLQLKSIEDSAKLLRNIFDVVMDKYAIEGYTVEHLEDVNWYRISFSDTDVEENIQTTNYLKTPNDK